METPKLFAALLNGVYKRLYDKEELTRLESLKETIFGSRSYGGRLT